MMNSMIFFYPVLAYLLFVGIHYVAVERKIKRKQFLIIAISSLLILYLDAFSYAILLFFSTAILVVIKKRVKIDKVIYPLTLLLILLLLVIKDYWVIIDVENIYIPLGLSYYYFRLLSLLIEYSKRPEELSEINLWDYYTYVFFFPIFLAGPIQRFSDFKMVKPNNYPRLYIWFLGALLLKLLVVDMLLFYIAYEYLIAKVSLLQYAQSGYPKALLLVSAFGVSAFLHAYMDLMLYTEMSKSLSRILGFSIQENFNRPLLASNISKFWQSWHMSLSNWTRDYIFFPTLLKTKKVWLSTFASMLTIGLWHSATLNWITWAISHAVAIVLYGSLKNLLVFKKVSANRYGAVFLRISGNFITLYFVSVVFIFVAIHDYEKAVSFIMMLFGL